MNDYDIIIKVDNISKCYKIFEKPIDRLYESLNPFGRRYSKDFYALRDISFTISKGESLGIIGKNGAGKSTLLKVLTKIVTPTSGSVTIKGKVAALLELGGSFNPEMTGIENIYLTGTIMGFTKKQMDEKIQYIVDFADIGEFINQPVKMYSSGMFARLAFAVNISVEPDILIIDEALSVGDVAFQYKCFQKMKDLKSKGVTLIFVSHSSQQIIQNCDRVILLNQGCMLLDTSDVKYGVTQYEKLIRNVEDKKMEERVSEILKDLPFDTKPNKSINEHRMGNYKAIISAAYFSDEQFKLQDDGIIESGKKICINFVILSKEDLSDVVLGISLRTKEGIDIWGDNNLNANEVINLKKGINEISYSFDVHIKSGDYLVCAGLAAFPEGKREELDQRWPIKIVHIVSNKEAVGIVYSPIEVNMR